MPFLPEESTACQSQDVKQEASVADIDFKTKQDRYLKVLTMAISNPRPTQTPPRSSGQNLHNQLIQDVDANNSHPRPTLQGLPAKKLRLQSQLIQEKDTINSNPNQPRQPPPASSSGQKSLSSEPTNPRNRYYYLKRNLVLAGPKARLQKQEIDTTNSNPRPTQTTTPMFSRCGECLCKWQLNGL